MGPLSCLTRPSPVSRSQALTGKVTKGCNPPTPLPSVIQGQGVSEIPAKSLASRQARVSEQAMMGRFSR